MDRQQMLKRFLHPDEKLLFAKVFDQVSLCLKAHEQTFTEFLDPHKAATFFAVLLESYGHELIIKNYGGFDDAERTMLGFSQSYASLEQTDFPISIIKLTFQAQFAQHMTHRDFLGAAIGLGIDRGKIGDIVIKTGEAFVFVHAQVADYMEMNLDKVGRLKVHAQTIQSVDYLSQQMPTDEVVLTVTSMRLDAIVSAGFHLPRSKVSDLIAGEKVFVNWTAEKNNAKIVPEGAMITVRGYGRIKLSNEISKTKNEKFRVQALLY